MAWKVSTLFWLHRPSPEGNVNLGRKGLRPAALVFPAPCARRLTRRRVFKFATLAAARGQRKVRLLALAGMERYNFLRADVGVGVSPLFCWGRILRL